MGKPTYLDCSFVIGTHDAGTWKGHPKLCGRRRGTRKDPRQERYDVGLCPEHMETVKSLAEAYFFLSGTGLEVSDDS